jgi:hypothetical protein
MTDRLTDDSGNLIICEICANATCDGCNMAYAVLDKLTAYEIAEEQVAPPDRMVADLINEAETLITAALAAQRGASA